MNIICKHSQWTTKVNKVEAYSTTACNQRTSNIFYSFNQFKVIPYTRIISLEHIKVLRLKYIYIFFSATVKSTNRKNFLHKILEKALLQFKFSFNILQNSNQFRLKTIDMQQTISILNSLMNVSMIQTYTFFNQELMIR